MANTKQVWDGKGVLWHGRKKIRVGERIPGGLPLEAHKSLKAKGFIKEVVIEKPDTAALDAAVKAAEEAEAAASKVDIKALTKAVQTAKGARTKATKDGNADRTAEAEATVTAAEAELADANVLAETAVRLRLDADVLANG